MKVQHWLQVGAALAVVAVAPAAQAHLSGTHDAGSGAGMLHLFIGHGYLLAMAAVGIWAALRGGRALLWVHKRIRRAKR
jgi:urease accessory protein